MSAQPDPSPAEHESRPAAKRSRRSPVTRMPDWYPLHPVLHEHGLAPGTQVLFWRFLSDYRLWMTLGRGPLFWGRGIGFWRGLYPDELSEALHTLEKIWISPHLVEDAKLAEACEKVWQWAEQREHLQVAFQFAELAARLDPGRSDRAATAGRMSRRVHEMARGTMWFQRALRQAVRNDSQIERAIARLGWSALERELGNLLEAENHAIKGFRAAMRAGRRSLAAPAAHEIMAALAYQDRLDEAWLHARSAIAMYRWDHPRLSGLAHDVAVLWSRMGYYSCALQIFELVIPLMPREDEHATAVCNLARAAAACGDRLRYERAMREMLAAIQEKRAVPAPALYHLACAARTSQDWDRAEPLAKLALARYPEANKPRARKLLEEMRARLPGDVDRLPEPQSDFDTARELLLKKLKKHAASRPPEDLPPPERYPMS